MNFNSISEKLDSLDLEDPYHLIASKKKRFLGQTLKALTLFHSKNCSGYGKYLNIFQSFNDDPFDLECIPALPVRVFKMFDLFSLDSHLLYKTLHSSGTSGQSVSKIHLDASTSKRQTKVLASITKNFIGKSRLPMIVVDSDELFRDRTKLNARAAGILGYSVFGRDHFYCLDKDLKPLISELSSFLDKHNNGPILIFGFTYVVWQSLIQYLIENNINLNFGNQGILIHGGGWKKLEENKVSNNKFKKTLRDYLGISFVHNYYGMVEQVGSIFMECDYGYFHCPDYSDVIIRDPLNHEIIDFGNEGVIQVLSILPLSYPGHSILTEDIGTIYGEDDCKCGRKGKYFKVSGRIPMAEIRGCSDTRLIST